MPHSGVALGGLRKQGRPRSSAIYQEKFLWLIPVLVAIFSLMLGEKHIADIIGACIGLGLFAFFVRRPGPALPSASR